MKTLPIILLAVLAGGLALAAPAQEWTIDPALLEQLAGSRNCVLDSPRYNISAPGGEPVEQGHTVHVTGVTSVYPSSMVIAVDVCFSAGGSLLGGVTQASHNLTIDSGTGGTYTINGDVFNLDFEDYYSADTIFMKVYTSQGGIPPVYEWASFNLLSALYTGPMPTPTPTVTPNLIPATGPAGVGILMAALGLLLALARRRGR